MKIKTLRQSRGWTQLELAQQLNTTQKVISDYETSKRKPPIERLPAIAALFNVTIEEIIGEAKLTVEDTTPHIHKNSRIAQVQEAFEQLGPDEQRAILKQIRALAASNQTQETTR